MRLVKTLAALSMVVVLGTATTGCGIYNKFDIAKQDSDLAKEYAQASQAEVDSTSLGNLPWQEVFTDPVLVDIINQALSNNVDLKNAKLNIDVAHANLLGARLSYLPSAVLAPNGAGAVTSIQGSKMTWTYQIPLSVSWEIDIFGRFLFISWSVFSTNTPMCISKRCQA